MIKIYADADYYQKEYLLGRKPVISAGFEFYARQSSTVIDRYTFDRITNLVEMPEPVQMCCCELAEQLYVREKRKKEAAGKTSEKIGTYSVSFASSAESAQSDAQEERNIVMKWLADTGLCYHGV